VIYIISYSKRSGLERDRKWDGRGWYFSIYLLLSADFINKYPQVWFGKSPPRPLVLTYVKWDGRVDPHALGEHHVQVLQLSHVVIVGPVSRRSVT
jgi:hypothetical protein